MKTDINADPVPLRHSQISMDENTLHISQGLELYKYVISSGSPYLNDQSTIKVIK